MKGDRMAKRSSFGSIVRKRLSDITNSIPQPKSPISDLKLSPTDSSSKEHIDHLVEENMALIKLIADKNKIIELTGKELQNLRIYLQKLQLQNWNLAQSNSHILAELNLGKEKLKALQHEIMCKDALLKAKNLELKAAGLEEGGEEAVDKSNNNSKLCKGQRRHPTRSHSMGPTTTSQQVADKDTSERKRRCLRRQSASFKSQLHKATENLFEIEDVEFPVGQPLDSSVGGLLIKKRGKNDENFASRSEPQESQRTSLGRPLRKAVEKVQSYKEIPCNIKMRRSE